MVSPDLKIIVGAGGTSQPGWISLNESDLNITQPDQWAALFEPGSISAIVAEHVWEHLTYEEGYRAAQNACCYLRPAGTLRIAVPDGLHPDWRYREWVAPGTGFNGQDHKVLYTYRELCELLKTAGFQTSIRECFDDEGCLFSQAIDDGCGHITRTAQSYEQTLSGSLVNWMLGTTYTSLIVDGVKRSDAYQRI